ncbi:hypothetical protein R2601_03748 [Salipiger bermudensis HTCC2601]|uniref:Uncharacterized protein n=1 Tax=Salipiger bermudensis (strain DSM 26914 / JCM 13377 / KCTC 12554 / HTCC2601) TaxID=314265 RepID=Q0FW96_SALBH|nr:hypothetical protein R2601_03748 [Salipiger bermudensis HTCC2601]
MPAWPSTRPTAARSSGSRARAISPCVT